MALPEQLVSIVRPVFVKNAIVRKYWPALKAAWVLLVVLALVFGNLIILVYAEDPVKPPANPTVPKAPASTAPSTSPATKPQQTPEAKPVNTTTKPINMTEKPQKSEAKPATAANAFPSQPVILKLQPQEQIYSSHQGLILVLTLRATQRAKVCMAKDIMTQLQMKVSKSGQLLALKPLVVKDNSTIFQEPLTERWLEPGELLTYRINLKRYQFADGTSWLPGEYSVSATYNLCQQSEDKPYDPAADDIPVHSRKPAWFMIMS